MNVEIDLNPRLFLRIRYIARICDNAYRFKRSYRTGVFKDEEEQVVDICTSLGITRAAGSVLEYEIYQITISYMRTNGFVTYDDPNRHMFMALNGIGRVVFQRFKNYAAWTTRNNYSKLNYIKYTIYVRNSVV